MDDERIRQLTEEVLSQVRGAPAPNENRSLESRVTALEAALAHRLSQGAEPPTNAPLVVHIKHHPSHQLLELAGGGGACILEPDKPCVHSGCCRTLGH